MIQKTVASPSFGTGSTWNRPAPRPATTPAPAGASAAAGQAFAAVTSPARYLANMLNRPSANTTTQRVGPGGTTVSDLARVAYEGIPGWRPGMAPSAAPVAPAPAPLDEASILSGLVGGPQPGYGKKYGGYPTAAYFTNAVKGAAYNQLLAGQMAAEEAARLSEPYQQTYARETDITNPYSTAGKTYQQNQATLATPLATLAMKMAGGMPSKEDYYGASMARMNAARGAGDVYGETGMPLPIAEQVQQNAMLSAEAPARRALEAGLRQSGAERYQQLADLIGGLAPSDLMQQIAVQQYGYDPALAAGLFTPSEDLAYQQMLNDAYNAQIARDYGIDVGWSVAETILNTQGPEALAAWQQQRAQDAIYGTPAERAAAEQDQLDAENAVIDQQIMQAYNFDPKKVSGVDADVVRSLMSNPTFADALTQAEKDILDGGDPYSIASNVAQQYADDTNDMMGAVALGKILASFDLSYFGS